MVKKKRERKKRGTGKRERERLREGLKGKIELAVYRFCFLKNIFGYSKNVLIVVK